MKRILLSTAVTLGLIAAAGSGAADEAEQEMNLSNTTYFGATVFTRTIPGRPVSQVLMAVYKSPLGEDLQDRPPTEEELDEMRRICAYMQRIARGGKLGQMDEYMIHFAYGDGYPHELDGEYRTVLGFTEKRGCDADPAYIKLF